MLLAPKNNSGKNQFNLWSCFDFCQLFFSPKLTQFAFSATMRSTWPRIFGIGFLAPFGPAALREQAAGD
jgi:hypothetical protein